MREPTSLFLGAQLKQNWSAGKLKF